MGIIEKEIDSLGRIVIPVRFRKKLGLKTNSKVSISLEGDVIFISSSEKICALCGKALSDKRDIRLCDYCIKEARRFILPNA